jgi:hypothetical protein
MHFSIRTLFYVAAALAIYYGYFLGLCDYYAPGDVSWRRQLLNGCAYSLSLYLPLALFIAILFERRRKLAGAWFAIVGVAGFMLWEFYVRPMERWVYGDLTDSQIDADWWGVLRAIYYRGIPALCWGLVIFAYFRANRARSITTGAAERDSNEADPALSDLSSLRPVPLPVARERGSYERHGDRVSY